jgi:TM2 domain-containing membrane protein YozV
MGNETNQTNVYVQVPPTMQPATKKISKVVYILLTFFLGCLGIHRFLRGQIGIGIIYILTLGGLGIAVLIDFIVSLVKLSNYSGADDYEFTISPRGHWTK